MSEINSLEFNALIEEITEHACEAEGGFIQKEFYGFFSEDIKKKVMKETVEHFLKGLGQPQTDYEYTLFLLLCASHFENSCRKVMYEFGNEVQKSKNAKIQIQ